MSIIEYGIARLVIAAYSATKAQIAAVVAGAVAVGCAGAMLLSGAVVRNAEKTPDPVPEYMTRMMTEATPAEISASLDAEKAYFENVKAVSGHFRDPGIQTYVPYTEAEEQAIEALACAIYIGAGVCDDGTMRMFGDVVLNRVNDNRFPDTVPEVVTEPGQFGLDGGIVWPDRATEKGERETVNRCYQIALQLWRGYHSEIYGNRYIWAATEPQGYAQIWSDGICFGK